VEVGVPKTQVLLWVSGEPWRAVLDHVVFAEYRCRDDWRGRQVTAIRDGIFSPTRFASPQGVLIPRHGRESLVVCRPQVPRRQARQFNSTPQLVWFEWMDTG
jgi:hypothetical protein